MEPERALDQEPGGIGLTFIMLISISQKVAFGVFTKAGVTFMGVSVTRLRNALGEDIEPYVGKGEEGDTITIPTSYLDILCPRLVKAGFIIRIDP